MGKILYVKKVQKNPINRTAPAKTYAQSQARAEMDIDQVAKHMSEHGSSFSRGTISAITKDLVDCVAELIKDGYIIRLGDLGTFNVTLRSKGVCESIVDNLTGEKPVFTAADIKGVNCRFTPGKALSNLIENVEFEETTTLDFKAKALKEKKQQIADGTYVGDNPKKPGVSEID